METSDDDHDARLRSAARRNRARSDRRPGSVRQGWRYARSSSHGAFHRRGLGHSRLRRQGAQGRTRDLHRLRMANPGGAVAAKKDEQIEHVLNAVFERVIAMGAVDGGLAVDAHVRGDAAESEGGEAAQLVAPAIPEVRPTVDEDDERAGFGAVGEIATATPPAALVELITPARLQGAAAQLGRHLARGPGNFGNFLALERRQLRQKADENATLSLICIKASWHFPFKIGEATQTNLAI